MKALREDITLPRVYGPLLERGMTLREIRQHSRYELMTMLASIGRYNVLKEGASITEDMRLKDPNASTLYAEYYKEIELYREQTKGKIPDEPAEQDSDNG